MSQQKRMAILVGGGPAPGINSVIGAATIRAVLEGVEVLGIHDGFEWLMQGDIDHVHAAHDRRREPHPLPRRLAPRHRARQPDEGSRSTSRTRSISLLRLGVDKLITIGGDDTAFSAMKLEEQRAGPHPRRPRAEDDRQRPRSAARRRHLRLPDRAPHRRRDREEPDGRREDDLALVLRDRDGPQGRAPRARHRQGGRRDAHADPRGVPRARRPAQDGRRHARRARSSSAWATGGATASRSSPRALVLEHRRPRTSPQLEDVERDAHGHIRIAEIDSATS